VLGREPARADGGAAVTADLQAPPVLRAIGRRVPVPTEAPWTLDVLGAPRFAILVHGSPAPKGSKSQGRNASGRTWLYEDAAARLKPWMAAVKAAARAALPAGWEPLDGPLIADQVFTVAKGVTLPKWQAWSETADDIDKYARGVNDALSQAGVWVDDKRLTGYRRLDKVFGGCGDRDALPAGQTGAVIRVWTLPQDLIDARKAEVRRKAPA
jgi:Holliday junction resolvase RusA-like endonuclease